MSYNLRRTFKGKRSFCSLIHNDPTFKSRDSKRTFDIAAITTDSHGNIFYVTQFNMYKYSIESKEQTHLLRMSINEGLATCMIWKDHIIYMTFRNSTNISMYDVCTGNISTLKYADKETTRNMRLSVPRSLAFDKEDNLLFTTEHVIQKINVTDQIVETIAGSTQGYKNGPAKTALFESPYGVAVGRDNTIYLSDENHCIRQIKNGIVFTIAGTPGEAGIEEGPFNRCYFWYPRELLVDIDGSILARMPNSIWRLDLNRKIARREGRGFIREATCLTIDKYGTAYIGGTVIYSLQQYWIHERFLWIGHLKEDASYCPLARLPKDIIKEIAHSMFP